MKPKKYDFGGYATKFNVTCTDGRVIKPGFAQEQDGKRVPLVFMHGSRDPGNIIGYAQLEYRPDGVYAYGVLNDSGNAANVGGLIEHSALNELSIHAARLVQRGQNVIDGVIREVSAVLGGANPGATIDSLAFMHFDGEPLEEIDEAYISSGEELEHMHVEEVPEVKEVKESHMGHSDDIGDQIEHADSGGEKTVGDVLATLNAEQQAAVGFLIDELEADQADNQSVQHSDMEGMDMGHSVFDQTEIDDRPVLTHEDFVSVMALAKKRGSFHDAFLEHMDDQGYELQHAEGDEGGVAGLDYGVANIDYMFPEARTSGSPEFLKRRTEWVDNVMSSIKQSPFSRIKTLLADITEEGARAKGYVKGTRKIEEVFSVLKRVTRPTTVYKKQKLDRDDVIDITDFDVIIWLKKEMRIMLDEELARAFLIGDGREALDPDKIDETCIRPIIKDDDVYSHQYSVTGATVDEQIDDVVRAGQFYQGSGSPSFYASRATITEMLLVKDDLRRRLYATKAELAAALGVKEVVEVEVMTGVLGTAGKRLMGIVVNLMDYTVGADKGGEINSFDDFDIDFNQHKYLIETRCSAALSKPKSALVLWLPAVAQG